jgi:hypothetical protein
MAGAQRDGARNTDTGASWQTPFGAATQKFTVGVFIYLWRIFD